MKKYIPLIVLAALLLSAAYAFAAPMKWVDEPNTYVIKLGDDSYLTYAAPRRLFQMGKNEVAGQPAARQGWGLGFYVASHPTARGQDACIYIEVIDPVGKLAMFAADYAAKLPDILSIRAMVMDGVPLKPSKEKFAGKDAWSIVYTAHPTNAVSGGKPGSCKAYIFDVDKVRVIVTAESQKDKYDPTSLINKGFSWSKKAPKEAKSVFKLLDTTYAVYRFITFELPSSCAPIYNDEPGLLAAWRVGKDGVLRFKATYVEDKPLKELTEGMVKVEINGASFYETRDKVKHTTLIVAKDGAGMLWKWETSTSSDEADTEIYNILLQVLGTSLTWAIKN